MKECTVSVADGPRRCEMNLGAADDSEAMLHRAGVGACSGAYHLDEAVHLFLEASDGWG